MKTFRKILSEVAQPKAGDEINFKAKHEIEMFDYPSDVEDQFRSKKGKTPARKADYKTGEDEGVYEANAVVTHKWYSTKNWKDGDSRFDGIDDLHHEREDRLYGPIKWGGDSSHPGRKDYHIGVPVANRKAIAYMDKNASVMKEAFTREAKLDPVDAKAVKKKFDDRKDKDIDNDGDVDNSDEYLHNRRKAISKAVKKESAELDEANLKPAVDYPTYKAYTTAYAAQGYQVIPQKLYSAFKKDQEAKMQKEEAELDEANTKYVIKHKKTKQVLNTHDDLETAKDEHEGLGADKKDYGVYKQTKKDASLRNRSTYREEADQLDEISKKTLGSYVKKASDNMADNAYTLGARDPLKPKGSWGKSFKRRAGIAKATDRLTKESVELNENFSAGAEKLNDGSTVILKKQDADLLNNLFKDLNPANKKKMMKVAMTDKAGFNEILGFAREAL